MPAFFAAQPELGKDTIARHESLRRHGVLPPDQRAAAAYNMALDHGRLVFALKAELKNVVETAGLVRQFVLDAGTGKLLAYGRTPADRSEKEFSSIGGGHSHFRVLPVGGRWWFPNAVGIYGSTDPAAPTDAARFDRTYAKLLRPVGCTVYRASPNYLFGSLTTYALDGSEVQHTNAARTTCDVGAFPANGLTYITPNHCFCQPYLPGHNVFHPRRPRAPDDAGRLEGAARRSRPRPAQPPAKMPGPCTCATTSARRGTMQRCRPACGYAGPSAPRSRSPDSSARNGPTSGMARGRSPA